MTAINRALEGLNLGEAQHFANLTITPLLAAMPSVADYLTLAEAQERGLAVVTEVSESGSVPTLLLENTADQAVFLLDGEELTGAKQNRIVNLTLLVPAQTTLEIPVSCVEQGRWSHRTEEFASSERAFFSKGRARKAERVSANLRETGDRQSDQGEVWDDIECKMACMAVSSDTAAIGDAYNHFAGSVDEYVKAFQTGDNQVGACFVINGKVRGIELFDVSETCGKLMPKLIRSYALDAIEEGPENIAGESHSISDFMQAVAAAPADSFEALGEGDDLRIHSASIVGGALAAWERVVHLCAFTQESEADTQVRSSRMRSASDRHRYRERYISVVDDDGDAAND